MDSYGFTLDPSSSSGSYGVGSDSYGFVGPQSNGTTNYPALAQPVNQAVDVGSGSSLGQYTPDVLKFLTAGLGAINQDYMMGQMMNYQTAQATQGGLVAQGQAAATVAQAQIAAMASSKNLLVIGLVVALVVFLKG